MTGSVSAVLKAFMGAAFTPFTTQAWKDKPAGGFTMSASQSCDKQVFLGGWWSSLRRCACSGSAWGTCRPATGAVAPATM
ncbi:hypothetical protein [Streptomyces sp. GbtcB6]|uniref:hypothetical protein n=1 Tax=Streptomyces sp. GbtcB6 TaxID=2824751 RepID=UPI0020C65A85|nr:hypothetical protein [Streptomyces sp. GbtcB6]